MSPLSPSRRFIASVSAFALALLTGCAPGTINYVHTDSSYDPTVMARIPYTGPLYADVSGNPFGIPQADLQRLVNNAIQPPGAKSEIGQGVRVHFAFGATAADRGSACGVGGNSGAAAAPGTTASTIHMVAALCRGSANGGALTYLVGSVDDVQGPSDPRFESFLRQATAQLFPKADPNRDHEPPCVFPSC
jgi:hypothetical protein